MSTSVRGARALVKKNLLGQKSGALALETVHFAHQAVAGDRIIDLSNLNTPSGFTDQPNPAILGSIRLREVQRNLRLYKGDGSLLIPGLSYLIQGQTSILLKFDPLAEEIFYATVEAAPINGARILDTRTLVKTGTLPAGETDINIGFTYKVNANPVEQLGEIQVEVNGAGQLRNEGNVTADPLADGNYEEVDAGNGFSTIVRMNSTSASERGFKVYALGRDLDRPNSSTFEELDVISGQVLRLAESQAAATQLPLDFFLGGSPTRTQLNQFGDILLGLLDLEVPFVTAWQSYTPTFSAGFGSVTGIEFEWRQVMENIEINGRWTNGTVAATAAEVGLPAGKTIFSYPTLRVVGYNGNGNASADNNYVVANPGVTYLVPIRGGIGATELASSFNTSEVQAIFASVRIAGQKSTRTLREHLEDKGVL